MIKFFKQQIGLFIERPFLFLAFHIPISIVTLVSGLFSTYIAKGHGVVLTSLATILSDVGMIYFFVIFGLTYLAVTALIGLRFSFAYKFLEKIAT